MTQKTWRNLAFISALLFWAAVITGAQKYPKPSHEVGAIVLFCLCALTISVFFLSFTHLSTNREGLEQFISERGGLYSFMTLMTALCIYGLGHEALGWQIRIWHIYTFGWVCFGFFQFVMYRKRLG